MRPELKARWINRYPDAVCAHIYSKTSESSCALKGPIGENQGLLKLRCPAEKWTCLSCGKGGSLTSGTEASHTETAGCYAKSAKPSIPTRGLAPMPGWAPRDSRVRYGLRVQRDGRHGGVHPTRAKGPGGRRRRSVALSPRFEDTCPWHRSRPLPLGFSWRRDGRVHPAPDSAPLQ